MLLHQAASSSSQVHKRRQGSKKSTERAFFLRLLSLQIREFFGRWFDNEVVLLTNVLLPGIMAQTPEAQRLRRSYMAAKR